MLLSAARTPAFSAVLHGGDYAEVRAERTRLLNAVWRSGSLETVERTSEEGGCARVRSKTGEGFVAYTDTDPRDALLQARSLARGLSAAGGSLAQREPVRGSFQRAAAEPVELVDLAEQIELLGRYHALALSAHPLVSGVMLFYRQAVGTVELSTSDGGEVVWSRGDVTLQITVYAGQGAERAIGSVSVGGAGDFASVRGLEERIEQAVRAAVDLVRAEPLDAGTYDVVCDGPLAALWAHETLGHLAEADYQLGDSGIAAALEPGRRIGPRTLTISDGPGPGTARGYTPVDDECSAGREVTLVERGVVHQARLHDRATAAAFGETPTGNARALSFRHRPLPRLRTTRVHPGPDTLDGMIAGIERGVLARGLLGGQTDRLGFSFTPAEALLIRDGQIRGPVRGVVLSGEIFESLRRISGIGEQVCTADTSASCGKQGQWPLPVSCWSPPIALRGLHVVP